MPRAWVPAGYHFTRVFCPVDGGDSAYSAHGYVRSELPPETCGQVVTTPDTVSSESGKICSRLAMARCKVSQLSVPDNELSSLVLGTRVTQHMLETVPEDPVVKVSVAFILDSQCTCLTINPALSQKERRRHNICVRTHRNLLNLSALFNGILIELYWAPGGHNAADLSSKIHSNLSKVLNSKFYRAGHASYSGDFPPPEAILFATIHSGVLKYRGLTSVSNHQSSCHFYSTHRVSYSDFPISLIFPLYCVEQKLQEL